MQKERVQSFQVEHMENTWRLGCGTPKQVMSSAPLPTYLALYTSPIWLSRSYNLLR